MALSFVDDSDSISFVLEDLVKRKHSMTDWEASFIDSIHTQFNDRGTLSKKQKEVLSNLWEKY